MSIATPPLFINLPSAEAARVAWWRSGLSSLPRDRRHTGAARAELRPALSGVLPRTCLPEPGALRQPPGNRRVRCARAALRHDEPSGELVGTVRLVQDSVAGFPLFLHCTIFPGETELYRPENTVVEVSRLSVSRKYRRRKDDGVYGDQAPEDRARRERATRRARGIRRRTDREPVQGGVSGVQTPRHHALAGGHRKIAAPVAGEVRVSVPADWSGDRLLRSRGAVPDGRQRVRPGDPLAHEADPRRLSRWPGTAVPSGPRRC